MDDFNTKSIRTRTTTQRGASTVESSVAVLVLITVLLAVFQGLLAYRAKISLNHAVTEAARIGSVNHAQSAPMVESMAEQLSPLYGGWGTGGAQGLVQAVAKSNIDLATPIEADGAGFKLHILNPTPEAFTAYGKDNNGTLEIPNHHLRHRDRDVDSNAKVNIQDANLLKIHTIYGYKLTVPIIDMIVAKAGPVFDPNHSAYYAADPPRLPLKSTAVVRMQTAARQDDSMLSRDTDIDTATAAVAPPGDDDTEEPTATEEPAATEEGAGGEEAATEEPATEESAATGEPVEEESSTVAETVDEPVECDTNWDDPAYQNEFRWSSPSTWAEPIVTAANIIRDFVSGVVDGAVDQLGDLWNLLTDLSVLRSLAESFIDDPRGTLRAMVEGVVDDVERVLNCGPRDIGYVVGQNLDPFVAVRIASRLARLTGNSRLLDYVDNVDPRIRCTVGASFPSGVQVLTAHGFRPIESLRVGELVATRKHQYDPVLYEPVAKTHTRIASDIYVIGTSVGTIEVTGEHPFYLHDQGWIRARDLARGYIVATMHGTATIYDKRFQSKQARVYNLAVDDGKTYFVLPDQSANIPNSLWVHNAGRRTCWDAGEIDVDANVPIGTTIPDGNPIYEVDTPDGQTVTVYQGQDGRFYDVSEHTGIGRRPLSPAREQYYRDRIDAADAAVADDIRYERYVESYSGNPRLDRDAWQDQADVVRGNQVRGRDMENGSRDALAEQTGENLSNNNTGTTCNLECNGNTSRPDSVSDNIVHEHKHLGGENQTVYNTTQIETQRTRAENDGLRHVVTISSDAGTTGGLPTPRPSGPLGNSSSVVHYYDSATGTHTHTWNQNLNGGDGGWDEFSADGHQ